MLLLFVALPLTMIEEHLMYRGAFTPAECELIADMFLQHSPPEVDNRNIPLLPNMEDNFRVSRVNHFDDGTLMARGALDFVYERLISLQLNAARSPLFDFSGLGLLQPPSSTVNPSEEGLAGAALQQLRSRVAFNLLHVFEVQPGGPTPEFDWHADTKPGDGKSRTLNLNIMLSKANTDFGGGELEVRSYFCGTPLMVATDERGALRSYTVSALRLASAGGSCSHRGAAGRHVPLSCRARTQSEPDHARTAAHPRRRP